MTMWTLPGAPTPDPGIYTDRQRREPDYTELVESIGARRAAQVMHEHMEDISK